MNDTHFDIVCAYLDGEIDEAAWQDAIAEHGDALEQLYQEESAIRGQIKALPRQTMPAALQESLNNITAQTSQKKPSLLFPIINTVVAVAASIMFVAMAFFLSPDTTSKHTQELGQLDDTSVNEGMAQAPESSAQKAPSEKSAKKDIPAADFNSLTTTDFAAAQEPRLAEDKSSELNRRREMKEQAARDPAVAVPAMKKGAHELADRISVEAIAEEETDNSTVANSDSINGKKERSNVSRSKKNDQRSDRQLDSGMHAGGMAASLSVDEDSLAKATVKAPATIQASEALSDDAGNGVGDDEMQLALAEARKNLKSNTDVKDAAIGSAQSKDKAPDSATIKKQRQVLQEALDVELAKSKPKGPSPKLNLKLGAQAKPKYLSLSIAMDDVATEWFAHAILDMKLIGLDRTGKQVWLSVIKTHQLNSDLTELRSDGLPSPHVQTLVLESLGQRSPAIASPVRSLNAPSLINAEADTAPTDVKETSASEIEP